jgi:hypothetical protein
VLAGAAAPSPFIPHLYPCIHRLCACASTGPAGHHSPSVMENTSGGLECCACATVEATPSGAWHNWHNWHAVQTTNATPVNTPGRCSRCWHGCARGGRSENLRGRRVCACHLGKPLSRSILQLGLGIGTHGSRPIAQRPNHQVWYGSSDAFISVCRKPFRSSTRLTVASTSSCLVPGPVTTSTRAA